MKSYPCHKCERRTPGCHGSCPDYQSRLEEDRAAREWAAKGAEADRMISECLYKRTAVFGKRMKKKPKIPGGEMNG